VNRCRTALAALVVANLVTSGGCSYQPARVHPPDVDPQEAGHAAIELYDANGDRQLDRAELAECPGILAGMARYDSDGDAQVGAEEIAARINQWHESGIGVMSVNCRVLLDGQPLVGAAIELMPEPFLTPQVQSSRGVTEDHGLAYMMISSDDLPESQQDLDGVHVGIYKARITHPEIHLPPKYNTSSTIGAEIAIEDQTGGITFRLSTQ
jgi:hypothetical protein